MDIEIRRIGVKIQKATGTDRAALQQQDREAQAGNHLCRATAEALAAARKTFGREAFDRFLQCIAPEAFHSTSTSSPDGLADTFLWVERWRAYHAEGRGLGRLRLWVARNHDAVSQPAEISVPSSHGIEALSLVRTHGNQTEQRLMADVEFRYVAN